MNKRRRNPGTVGTVQEQFNRLFPEHGKNAPCEENNYNGTRGKRPGKSHRFGYHRSMYDNPKQRSYRNNPRGTSFAAVSKI
jgi:hypothetical protein